MADTWGLNIRKLDSTVDEFFANVKRIYENNNLQNFGEE